MEIMSAVWRSLTGSTSADAAAAKTLLESIQRALYEAFLKHRSDGGGIRALSAEEIAPIKELCDQLTPAIFQLKVPEPLTSSAREARQQHTGRNRVRYQHIWENELFSMGIFILPPGASIPLHDHPEMSVISRVLYGSLHVTSCDLVPTKKAAQLFHKKDHDASPTSSDGSSSKHVARIFHDALVSAPHTTALLPDQGNLHEFVADDEQGCAIFDILTPPYEPEDGRDCTYYRVASDTVTDDVGQEFVQLEEFEPYNFEVVSEPYHGPKLSFPSV